MCTCSCGALGHCRDAMPPKPCKTLFLHSPRPCVTSATPDAHPHTSAPVSDSKRSAMTRLSRSVLSLPFATLGTTVRAVHCCRGWEKLPSRMTAPKRAAPGPAFFCASCRMRSLLETSQPIAKRKSGTCAGRSRKDQLAPAPQRGPRGRHPGVSKSSSGGMFHLLLRGERRDRAVARKPALSRCTSPPDVLGAAPASPRHGAMPPALRCRTRPAQHVPRLARLVSRGSVQSRKRLTRPCHK